VQAAVRHLEQLGASGGATLAEAFRQVVDQTRGDVVLIVDEVQQAITSEEGHQMLLALKAARDAINPRPGTPGHFLLLGTGVKQVFPPLAVRKATTSERLSFAMRSLVVRGSPPQPQPCLRQSLPGTVSHAPRATLFLVRCCDGRACR
jgi:hypothetical protein